MNDGCVVTYMGGVSYMKLVLTIDTSAFSSRQSRRALGTSRRRNAVSMFMNRSPRFEPSAMAAICGVEFDKSCSDTPVTDRNKLCSDRPSIVIDTLVVRCENTNCLSPGYGDCQSKDDLIRLR